MANNDSIYVTVRLDYEYGEQYTSQEAKAEATNRISSFLSSANLYDETNRLRIADVEVCDINA